MSRVSFKEPRLEPRLESRLKLRGSFKQKGFSLIVGDRREESRLLAQENGTDQEAVPNAVAVALLDLKRRGLRVRQLVVNMMMQMHHLSDC